MFPYKEDLCRFDFEVREEDEWMCNFAPGFKEVGSMGVKGLDTPMESDTDDSTK